MSGFVKIYGKILKSSVWVGQPAHVRLTWLALLVLADRRGNVMSSVPGLAQDAGVSIPEVQQALEAFQKPDPFSRTPEHEGRRIVPIDGGWHVLNHDKYREMRTESQIANAERQAKLRTKRRSSKAPAGGFEPVIPSVRGVRPNATGVTSNASDAAPGVVGDGVTAVTSNASNAPLCTLYSDPTDQPDQEDPDPIPDRPAKDGPARASRHVTSVTHHDPASGVFDAPVLTLEPQRTFDVPEWWTGPKAQHTVEAQLGGVDLVDEARRFRLYHFGKPFPATERGIDKRFSLWLGDAKKRGESERAAAMQGGRRSAEDPGTRGHERTEPTSDHRRFAAEHGLDVDAILAALERDAKFRKLGTPSKWAALTRVLEREAAKRATPRTRTGDR